MSMNFHGREALSIWVRILRRIFKLQRAAYNHRRYSLALVALLIVVIGSAALDVRHSNDPMLFFSEDNAHRQKLEEFRAIYGSSAATLIVLDAGSPDAPLHLLEAERYLSEILLNPDHPLAISYLTNLGSPTATLPAIGYPTEFTPLEDVQFIAKDHPALRSFFFNDDLSATTVILSLDQPDQSDPALIAAYRAQMALLDHMRDKYPNLTISIVGNVTTFEALREAFEQDSRYIFPATAFVNFLVLLFAFGNLRVTLSVLVIGGLSVILTQGVAGWSGYVFAAGSTSSFSIVFTLTVASLIHMVHAMGQRQHRLPFQHSHTIILSSFRKLTVPVLLAHMTTAVGFVSLNWADAPAFKAMGNLVAIGLVFSLILTLLVAPIALKSHRRALKIRDDRVRAISRWFANAWAGAPIRNALIVSVLSLAALAGLTRIVFDDQITNNFPEDHPLLVNIDNIVDAFGWSHSIDLVLKYDEGELIQPDAIADVDTLVNWIKTQHPVGDVFSPMPLIKDCLAQRQPPYTGALNDIPKKMLNYCVRTSGRAADDKVGFFALDYTQLHLKIMLPRISAAGVRDISEKIESKTAAMGFPPENAIMSGVGVMSAYLSAINTQNMLVGSAFAMLVVSLLIGLFLRSPILAFLSILPNFLPAMAALGLWVWINGQVGMAAAIIAAVTFGIVVDDTIHILYALARGKHTQTRAGIRRVLRNVTPGVLTTTAALGFGFAILMFSGFEVNRQLGFLTSTTIFIAFLFDIFVLPGLYSLLKGKR